jgi:hypothetical protein
MKSKFLSLNFQDILHTGVTGAIAFVGTAVWKAAEPAITSGHFNDITFPNLKAAAMLGIGAWVSNLAKRYVTSSDDKILTAENA